MTKSKFVWESKVRDYELDSLGIVNNATFINYLEQSRNDSVRALGIDFIECHHAGYTLVVAGIDIRYLSSLRARDEFYVTAELSSYNDKRVYFKQEIRFKENDKLAAKALVHIACVDRETGKSYIPDLLKNKMPADKYKRRDT